MKFKAMFVVPALLSALMLSACGEKEAEVTPVEPEATTTAEPAQTTEAAATESAEPKAAESGGYVPSAEELVPGVTMTQEEIDAKFAEARANTPLPVIPGEAAPAAAPEAAAPEAAAAEAK